MDMATFSAYQHIVDPPTWHQERTSTEELFLEWVNVFDEIKALMGNHDRRLIKYTAAAFDETDILSIIQKDKKRWRNKEEKIQLSARGWCEIIAPSGLWRVTHPKNYSINQLVVADQIAQKFRCNVITAHEHHTAQGWDRFGNYVIINIGTLADQNKFAYVAMDDNKGAGMKHSFATLINGVPTLYGDYPVTDWGKA
jgi:hypothetical protein